MFWVQGDLLSNTSKKMLEFCLIQMEVIRDRESTLRKQLLNCKIQSEFLSSMVDDLQAAIHGDENDRQ